MRPLTTLTAVLLAVSATAPAHADASETWAKRYLAYNGDSWRSDHHLDPIATRLARVSSRCHAAPREVALAWTIVYRASVRRWEDDPRARANDTPKPTARQTAFLFYNVINDAYTASGRERLSKSQCVEAVELAIDGDDFPALVAAALIDESLALPVPRD